MANHHSTATTLPGLETLMDAVNEFTHINSAFESYHQLLTAYLLRLADQEQPRESYVKFIQGLDVIFYSTYARSERLEGFIERQLQGTHSLQGGVK